MTRDWHLLEPYIEEQFVRASGPGGQNVNKVSSAVELRFHVERSPLAPEVRARLRQLAGRRTTADGAIVLDSREHRTQAQNREAARARLVALIEQASRVPKTRKPTRPKAAAREKRLTSKKRRSDVKRFRQSRSDD